MTFRRPTLDEIRARIAAEFQARLPGADTTLRQSNLRVIGDVIAALNHAHHGHMVWLARQIIPDTAEDSWLDRWADIFGIQRKPAAFAIGAATVTGTDGTAIPAGTRLRRADGAEFEALAGAVIAGGTATLAVRARLAGAGANSGDGTALRLTSAISGADSEALAAGEIAGGSDVETDDDLRGRMLLFLQAPPQGGAASDYAQWALEVPGVTRVWVSAGEMGLGTVTVRFMMDEVRAAFGGVPQGTNSPAPTGDQLLVHDHVNVLRPVTAELFVVAPVLDAVDVTISGLVPDTAEVRAAIETELADMLFRVATPGGTVPLSKIWEAISLASGETSHVVVAPAADVVTATGHLAVLGTITHV